MMGNSESETATDLRHEEARVYVYPNGDRVEVEMPATVIETKTGHHNIVDVAGIGVVVAPGWRRIDVYPRFGCGSFGGIIEPVEA